MPGVGLRRATVDDLPALNALMHASSAYDGAYRAMLDGYFVTDEQVARDLVVLADRDGEVLGFYSLIIEGVPELDLMFVADAAQGLGLGETLFRHMLGEGAVRGIVTVRIVSHPPALGFYERMGARRIGGTEPIGRITWSRPILEVDCR